MPHISRSAWPAARRISQIVCLAAFALPARPVRVHRLVPGPVGPGAPAVAGVGVPRSRPPRGGLDGDLDAHALPLDVVEPRRPGADVLPRPVLLRLGLPAGHAAPLLLQRPVGEEARQGAHRVESLQEVAGVEVLRPRGAARLGRVRVGALRPARPDSAAGALARAVDPAGCQLRGRRRPRRVVPGALATGPPRRRRGAGGPAAHGGRVQAAALPPGLLPRGRSSSACSRSTCGSRASGAARCARSARCSAWPRAGRSCTCARTRASATLQPVPPPLPGRRRPDPRPEVAKGRVPPVPELRDRVPDRRHSHSASAGCAPPRRRSRPRTRAPDAAGVGRGRRGARPAASIRDRVRRRLPTPG